jgi:hypothetical protein
MKEALMCSRESCDNNSCQFDEITPRHIWN